MSVQVCPSVADTFTHDPLHYTAQYSTVHYTTALYSTVQLVQQDIGPVRHFLRCILVHRMVLHNKEPSRVVVVEQSSEAKASAGASCCCVAPEDASCFVKTVSKAPTIIANLLNF